MEQDDVQAPQGRFDRPKRAIDARFGNKAFTSINPPCELARLAEPWRQQQLYRIFLAVSAGSLCRFDTRNDTR
jgi:hypothetical protein